MIGSGMEVGAQWTAEAEDVMSVFHLQMEHVEDHGIDRDFVAEFSEQS